MLKFDHLFHIIILISYQSNQINFNWKNENQINQNIRWCLFEETVLWEEIVDQDENINHPKLTLKKHKTKIKNIKEDMKNQKEFFMIKWNITGNGF